MESASRTLVCSVLFLDIVEYSKKPVAEQLQLKQAFNRVLAEALAPIAARDRVILDTGDGAAVTFLGDPEDAIFASLAIRDSRDVPPVRLGMNLGPVRLVRDLNGQVNIIGDGINVAQRVMGFSSPRQLLVSRSFYEVVSCLSRDYASLFHHEGARTDKHVREHEVYSVGNLPDALRRTSEIHARQNPKTNWLFGTGPLGFSRSALIAAPLAFFVLVGAGVAVRAARAPDVVAPLVLAAVPPPEALPVPLPAPLPAEPAKAEPVKAEPAPVPAAKPEPPAPKATRKAERPAAKDRPLKAEAEKKAPQARTRTLAAAPPGRVILAIAPWGEVIVDGRSRGISPPVQAIELEPGPHTVEIRNGSFPSHIQHVMVKSGEPVRIRHRFR